MPNDADDVVPSTTIISECAEIASLEAFDRQIDLGITDVPLAIQGLDLRTRTDAVLNHRWPQTVFLGAILAPEAAAHVRESGATLFPPFANLPYNPYRGSLYTPAELRNGLDEAIYEHQARWRKHPPAPILEALAQRIHDHAVDDALQSFLSGHKKVVAIMGGHSLKRSDDTYRRVAIVARQLARTGYLVVTGGGPGAMEAGNLGAWLSPQEDAALDEALGQLSDAVDYTTSAYLDASAAVVEQFGEGATSLAIPTWFYGHEPTNDFATHVAKYFSNSIREDGLLAIATHGVIYTPGAAGTVQEVFMDATQNHYNVFNVISPMVFVDSAYWADDRLAAPLLLSQLSEGRPYSNMIAVLDEPEDVVEFLASHPPISG